MTAHRSKKKQQTATLFLYEYIYIYISYELTAINNVTNSTGMHTLLAYAPEQMCLQHCTYISHCTLTLVYLQTPHYCKYHEKSLKPAIFIYHTNTKYVPATIMPLKCYKHASSPKYLTCIYGENVPIYMPHMSLLPSLMQPELLYTNSNDPTTQPNNIY